MNYREPAYLELAKVYSGIKALQEATYPDEYAPDALAALRRTEATLDHLLVGARIAFAALERQSVPLTDEEREWFAAELKRKGDT